MFCSIYLGLLMSVCPNTWGKYDILGKSGKVWTIHSSRWGAQTYGYLKSMDIFLIAALKHMLWVLVRTHNICFCAEIRKIICRYCILSGVMIITGSKYLKRQQTISVSSKQYIKIFISPVILKADNFGDDLEIFLL